MSRRSISVALLVVSTLPCLGCAGMQDSKTMAASSPTATLTGTSWQLVKFQSSDDTTLIPEDKSKYTLTFGADGQLAARVDCNRGSSSWKSNGPNQLELGPMATTRAMCPPGSLHDQIVKRLPYVRSYRVKGSNLYLSLQADGGVFEFEPAPGHK